MSDFKIPGITVYRLALYARALERFLAEGKDLISSEELARECGVNSAQLRKDLSYFGQFGVRGVGYSVPALLKHIKRILGTDREWPMVLAGVGHLGMALLNYDLLAQRGFRFVAAFDVDEKKIGRVINDVYVYALEQFGWVVKEHPVKIGVIATPASAAQEVADLFIEHGIKGILNFAPVRIKHPKNVVVEHSDLTILFDKVAFYTRRLD
ncbi:MAG: redox-sensing transcriptional repressor Rex [Thermodesulfobacteria bacterium]|nr:redox-sensing transcriptional repressor Rex [Thermodesulfobacteriota bacterium]